MNREKAFKSWLERNPNRKYSPSTINNYLGALRNATQWFEVTTSGPLFEMSSADELKAAADLIAAVPNYDEIDYSHGHRNYSAAIKLYQKYMEAMSDFTWVTFYSEFADKLLPYKTDRHGLIEKLIKIYDEIGIKFPKLESGGLPGDIDPFTVFGLFNKGISESNRISILKEMAKVFDVGAEVPTEFPGIPVLNNLKATFYHFKDERGENDIDHLWEVFEAALKYADTGSENDKKTFIECFDAVLPQGGIRWNITMALFWIRPNAFISLDSRNREFLKDKDCMPENFVASVPKFDNVPAGEDYVAHCDNCKKVMAEYDLPFTTFPELSAYAWSVTKDTEEDDESDDNGAMGDADVKKTRYWMYAPGEGACKWDEFYKKGIMAIGWSAIGDLSDYESKEAMKLAMKKAYDDSRPYKMSALATWQFANEIQVGDVIFVKRGRDTIIGRGIVTGEYRFDAGSADDYKNIHDVNWTHNGEWGHPGNAVLKTLTEITSYTEYVEKLCAIFEDDSEDTETAEKTYPIYSREDFLSEVYMTDEDYDTLVGVLGNRKNIILQGAPGVGKTFAAKRLAYSIIGEKNPDRVQMVQFHQSYSYEDFIEGYRPASKSADGADFIIKKGSFYKFCKKASEDDENDYFFIIDEINRGNLSKIFGELFMLIETDKRGVELQLLYSDEKFFVPKNVYIIGMMNTADRSLAMLDYALRRRFSFIEMKPGFETDGFMTYQDSLENEKFNSLISCVKQLNTRIADDAALGEGFCIGHSYFCNLDPKKVDDRSLSSIVEFELLPLLKEYWFDEADKVSEWRTKLRSAIK